MKLSDEIKILVVTTDITRGQEVSLTLKSFQYRHIYLCTQITSALQLIREVNFDIAIIDIYWKDQPAGVEVAREINSKHHFPFIFITLRMDGSTIQLTKAFFHYGLILWPFRGGELFHAIHQAIHHYKLDYQLEIFHSRTEKSFLWKGRTGFSLVKFSNILYVETNDQGCEIRTEMERFNIREKMRDLKNVLPQEYFYPVHNGLLINIYKISVLKLSNVTIGDLNIEIEKNQYGAILEKRAQI